MNKLKVLLALVAIVLMPNVYAAKDVTIESIELVDKSTAVTELSEPTVKGLNVSFDLSFSDLDDFAKYKIVLDNPTNEDYEVAKENEFKTSEYLQYTYEFDKDTNIVKKNSKLTMYINIKYNKAVPSNKLTDGKYVEANEMAITLGNNNADKIVNPKTGNSILLTVVVLAGVIALSVVLYKKTSNKKYLNVMLLGLVLIPIGTFALQKLQVNVATKVTIEDKYSVYYGYQTLMKVSTFEQEKDDYVYIHRQCNNGVADPELDDLLDDLNLADQAELNTCDEYSKEEINGVEYYSAYVVKRESMYSKGTTVKVTDYDKIYYDGSSKKVVNGDRYSYWYYEANSEKDILNMNFKGTGAWETDAWDDNNNNIMDGAHYIRVKLPKTFVMPEHDVYFEEGGRLEMLTSN